MDKLVIDSPVKDDVCAANRCSELVTSLARDVAELMNDGTDHREVRRELLFWIQDYLDRHDVHVDVQLGVRHA